MKYQDIEIFTAKDREEGYSAIEAKMNLELQLSRTDKFERQFHIGPYFADFYFPENHLVLELDGQDYHSTGEQVKHDRGRDGYMNEKGFVVVRVSGDVALSNPSGVLNAIRGLRDVDTFFIKNEEDLKNLMTYAFLKIQQRKENESL